MAPPATFLIVDDHPVLRQGIGTVLRTRFTDARILEADSLESALSEGEAAKPDVVIVDPRLGEGDPTTTISTLRRKLSVPVVAFAENGDMRVLAQALKAGAKACVRKDSRSEVLARAIEAARSGEFYIDSALADAPAGGREHGELALTDRQREILQMYADGVHTERVAEALGLSTETVRTHTKRILAKLGANTRTHAVAIAVRAQLLD